MLQSLRKRAPKKSTFALFVANRGFFPQEPLIEAKNEVADRLRKLGHEVLLLDSSLTRNGAVETPREGAVYAEFLRQNYGKFDGVVAILPTFGDENGAAIALQDAGVPIFIQAYPDEMDKMGPEDRRDSFCGKVSIMDVLRQYGVKFTILKPHTVHPSSLRFAQNIAHFDVVCRVFKGMRRTTIGAIGARTSPFKTVRFDEKALQRRGVTVETVDYSEVERRIRAVDVTADDYREYEAELRGYANWEKAPAEALITLSKMGVALNDIIDERQLDALALRCWIDGQIDLGVSPCVILSLLNNLMVQASCEVDIQNAVMMRALSSASGQPAACLDWNNNHGAEDDECIVFHCGPVPQALMEGPGEIDDHHILKHDVGEGRGWGCCTGRIRAGQMIVGSTCTEDGSVRIYLANGEITGAPIPPDFFGCAGVARIIGLQDLLIHIGKNGYCHHTSMTLTDANILPAVREALVDYLGYEITGAIE